MGLGIVGFWVCGRRGFMVSWFLGLNFLGLGFCWLAVRGLRSVFLGLGFVVLDFFDFRYVDLGTSGF